MGTGGPCAIVTPTFSFSLFICQLKCKTLLRFCLPKSVFGIYVGIDLFSRTVASQVSSAPHSLTSVFGMGTGGPCAIVTPTRSRLRRHTSRSFLRNIHITTTVLFNCPCNPFGAPPETRTPDPLIKSQLLYQLS